MQTVIPREGQIWRTWLFSRKKVRLTQQYIDQITKEHRRSSYDYEYTPIATQIRHLLQDLKQFFTWKKNK